MSQILNWPGFYWIGAVVAGIVVVALLAILAILAMVVIASIRLKFHCRKPATNMVLSAYRADITSGEGRPIKAAEDLRVARILGCSWKLKWVFGLLIFETPQHR